MKKTIFILAIPIALSLLNNKARASTFKDALSDYCVPKESEYCTGPYSATYDKDTDSCKCKNTTYLRYNAEDRHCEINCPSGYVPSVISSCPSGSVSFLVAE